MMLVWIHVVVLRYHPDREALLLHRLDLRHVSKLVSLHGGHWNDDDWKVTNAELGRSVKKNYYLSPKSRAYFDYRLGHLNRGYK